MDDVKYRKTELLAKIGRLKTFLIIAAVIAVLTLGGGAYLHILIGDGQPVYDTVVIPKEEYASYTRDAEPRQYVQADVVALRHVFGVVHQMVSYTGSKLIPEQSNYAEMTLEDGSVCLLTWDGDQERLEEFVSAIDRRQRAAQLGLNNVAPVTVYGRTTLLAGTDILADQDSLERTDSGMFPLKPQGLTDAEYWNSLTGIAVIDLDLADATGQMLNVASARRMETLKAGRIAAFLVGGAMTAAGVILFILLKQTNARFLRLVMQEKQAA